MIRFVPLCCFLLLSGPALANEADDAIYRLAAQAKVQASTDPEAVTRTLSQILKYLPQASHDGAAAVGRMTDYLGSHHVEEPAHVEAAPQPQPDAPVAASVETPAPVATSAPTPAPEIGCAQPTKLDAADKGRLFEQFVQWRRAEALRR